MSTLVGTLARVRRTSGWAPFLIPPAVIGLGGMLWGENFVIAILLLTFAAPAARVVVAIFSLIEGDTLLSRRTIIIMESWPLGWLILLLIARIGEGYPDLIAIPGVALLIMAGFLFYDLANCDDHRGRTVLYSVSEIVLSVAAVIPAGLMHQ